jgi:hypothetical protein
MYKFYSYQKKETDNPKIGKPAKLSKYGETLTTHLIQALQLRQLQ